MDKLYQTGGFSRGYTIADIRRMIDNFEYDAACRALRAVLDYNFMDDELSALNAELMRLRYFRVSGSVLTGYSGCLEEVVVPSGITEIAPSVFVDCPELKSISLPLGLRKIGGHNFVLCPGLSSVVIPNSTTEIGASAFTSCSSLGSVRLGFGVRTVGMGAFSHCPALAAVEGIRSDMNIGKLAFSNTPFGKTHKY